MDRAAWSGSGEGAGPASYGVALLVGLIAAFSVVPLASLLATRLVMPPELGDWPQFIAGQRYFIADAWRWPLLLARPLGYPDGTSIAMTDSIPLAALAAKSVRALLPDRFQAVMPWFFLCHLLQPLAAVFALRSMGERRLLPAVAAAVLAASMPALLFRVGHVALCSHFLLLLAIGLYFRLTRGGGGAVGVPLLLVATLLIHPYLLVMVAAVLAAAPLSLLWRGQRGWRAALLLVGLSLALTAGLALLLGYAGVQPLEAGFGVYSMNLYSPVYPGMSWLFPSFGITPDATGGQSEGYNYLGAGLLLLLLACLVGAPLAPRWHLGRHSGLVLVAVVLTGLALSNAVYAGHHRLLFLRDYPQALGAVRASGRFFWPVAYLLLLAAVLQVSRLRHAAAASVLLVAAMLLQSADSLTLRGVVRSMTARTDAWTIDAARLGPLMHAHRLLAIEPRYGCAGWSPRLMQVVLLASEQALPVNTTAVARFAAPPDCGAEGTARPLGAGELRVLQPPARALAVPGSREHCGVAGDLAVCSAGPGVAAGLAPLRPPPLPVGPALVVAAGADLSPLVAGWASPDGDGVWSEGPTASIVGLPTPEPGQPRAGALILHGWALAPSAGGAQRVTLTLEGRSRSYDLPEGARRDLAIELDPDRDDQAPLSLTVSIGHPVSPAARGISSDPRPLGFRLQSLRLAPSS